MKFQSTQRCPKTRNWTSSSGARQQHKDKDFHFSDWIIGPAPINKPPPASSWRGSMTIGISANTDMHQATSTCQGTLETNNRQAPQRCPKTRNWTTSIIVGSSGARQQHKDEDFYFTVTGVIIISFPIQREFSCVWVHALVCQLNGATDKSQCQVLTVLLSRNCGGPFHKRGNSIPLVKLYISLLIDS